MAADLYRRLPPLLREGGCELLRQGKGSHEIWCSPLTKRTFSVPANITSQRLGNEILKQAGLPKAFWTPGQPQPAGSPSSRSTAATAAGPSHCAMPSTRPASRPWRSTRSVAGRPGTLSARVAAALGSR
jgi:hypothetical protein